MRRTRETVRARFGREGFFIVLFALMLVVHPRQLQIATFRRARLTALGIEIMVDNADPRTKDVYAALDMPFATLIGHVAEG